MSVGVGRDSAAFAARAVLAQVVAQAARVGAAGFGLAVFGWHLLASLTQQVLVLSVLFFLR